MSVFERTREIGVLSDRAGKLQIFSLIWTETLALTAVGGSRIALAARIARWRDQQFVPPRPRVDDPVRPAAAIICVLAVLALMWSGYTRHCARR